MCGEAPKELYLSKGAGQHDSMVVVFQGKEVEE